MKKKLVSAILCTAMVASTLAGCGSSAAAPAADGAKEEAKTEEAAADTEEAAEEEAATDEVEAISTKYGDPNGTPLELWSFVEAHCTYYGHMAEVWNEQNPDRTIYLNAVTYPYSDMHNKLLMALNAGTGAPDICDVEVSQYPNVVAGETAWLVPLDQYIEDGGYMDTIVKSRIDTYAGADGHYYGAPFHVGAFIGYWNVAAMSEVMGISQDEVKAKIDAIVTWDDYTALGEEYMAANPGEGKYFTSVDVGGCDYLWLAMAEYGEDYTGGFDNPANVEIESVKKMLNMEKGWLESGIAQISPDGHVDLEAGYNNIAEHNIVSFNKAAWYMSRFINYMPEEKGNWYLSTCPVFEEGQINSVGVGGTGTVVTTQSPNQELAAEFDCWAKMGAEGELYIWENLGFDVCNTALWTDDSFAHDDSNQYNQFFQNYPYDVLNAITGIGKISVVSISPTINEQMTITTLNSIFEDGQDIDEALAEAQAAIDLEQ